MTSTERGRRYRERHQLPTPKWQRNLLVIEAPPLDLDENDPLYGAALEQATTLEAAVEREGEEEE